MMRTLSLAAFLAMVLTGTATAAPNERCVKFLLWEICSPTSSPPTPFQAPEIDPATACEALTLLAGGLVVLRSRRAKKK